MSSNAQAIAPGRRRGRFWIVTLAALIVFAGTFALGRWQLSRAAQKEAIQADADRQQKLPPIEQQDFLAQDNAVASEHRQVHLRGLWLQPHTLYLDNRQMNGLQGFYVLTPFAIQGSDQTIMVQRGFIQRNFNDRTALQPVETPAGLVDLVAVVAPPPGHLLQLGKTEEPLPKEGAVGSSAIRQNLDLQAFRTETGLPLRIDVSLQQYGPASEGLQRDWPAPSLGIETHYGYAFQWFGLSALVAILYVWFQFIAPLRRRRR